MRSMLHLSALSSIVSSNFFTHCYIVKLSTLYSFSLNSQATTKGLILPSMPVNCSIRAYFSNLSATSSSSLKLAYFLSLWSILANPLTIYILRSSQAVMNSSTFFNFMSFFFSISDFISLYS